MQSSARKIRVSVSRQCLELLEDGQIVRTFPVSTSAYGLGTEPGSSKTPLGRFIISEKFGDGAPPGMIFKSRESTGEFGTEEEDDDFVQTRILWLDGQEEHNANSHDRYIYIHGTNHESAIGQPASHGCVRMRNTEVVELYDLVDTGTEVVIEA